MVSLNFALFLSEETADLGDGATRSGNLEPVTRGTLGGRGQDLHGVAGLELVAQGNHATVRLRPSAPHADIGVHGIGEVESGRPHGKVLHISLRREDEDLIRIELNL